MAKQNPKQDGHAPRGHLVTARDQAISQYRTARAKITAAGDLDPEQQIGATATGQLRRQTIGRINPQGSRLLRVAAGHRSRGALRGPSRTPTGHNTAIAVDNTIMTVRESVGDGAQLDTEQATGQAADFAGRVATKHAILTSARTLTLSAKGYIGASRIVGKTTIGTTKTAAALTYRAATSTTARTATLNAVRSATIATKTVAAAILSTLSTTGLVPIIAAVVAIVLLIVAILPAFLTGPTQTMTTSAVAAANLECATGRTYPSLGPVQPHVNQAATLLGNMFDVKTIGGYRPGNTYDTAGHPAGLAIDLMVPLTPAGRAKGQAIADYARRHADQLGVKYVIWYQQIWSTGRDHEGWRPMPDRGTPSANHLDHPHISFNPAPGTGDLTAMLNQACNNPPAGTGAWVNPVDTMRVSSPYGMRRHPVTGVYKLHSGTDYAGGQCGAPIYATAAGTVTVTHPAWAGSLITIDHGDGLQTRYAHMERGGVQVSSGDTVTPGQTIGQVGTAGLSTGCHLHFEARQNNEFINPANLLTQKNAS